MKIRQFTVSPPQVDMPIVSVSDIAPQPAAASGAYEQPIFYAHQPVIVNNIVLTPGATVTATSALISALGFVNWYRNGVQLGEDGNVAVYPTTSFGTGKYSLAAFTGVGTGAPSTSGAAFTGFLTAAVTAGSSTGATINIQTTSQNGAVNSGLLPSTAILNSGTLSLVVDYGTAVQETIKISAMTLSSATAGTFTIAAGGFFANAHLPGAPVQLLGSLGWAGTSTPMSPWTGVWTSGGTIGTPGAQASVVLTGTGTLAIGQYIVVDTSVAQETVALTALTGTGPYTVSFTTTKVHAGTPAVTAGTTGALTAIAPSLLTKNLAAGQVLFLDYGTSNAESGVIATYASGTGVYTLAASVGGTHIAGCSAVTTANARYMQRGDVLTFKWAQAITTGMALPATRVEVNYSIGTGMKY